MKDAAKLKPSDPKKDLESFFVIGPLGFEESLQEEIALVQPWLVGADGRPSGEKIEIQRVRKGGLEILAPRLEGFQLVHHLKSPVRILWRWKSKKISHVSELKTYIRGLRPQDLLDGPLDLQIQSRKSRLQNEKMLHRVFKEDWPQVQEGAEQKLYVDVYDDQFTFSWDLCGEPLFKRGWTPLKGVAPLRENLARLLLWDLVKQYTGPELSEMTLVDPMMGSGTFLWEALGWNQVNVNRKFSYQSWKGIPGVLKTSWWTNLQRPRQGLFQQYWGCDQDPQMVKVAQSNEKFFSSESEKVKIHLNRRDVLDQKSEVPSTPVLLVSNPPYGERIQVQSVHELIQASLKTYRPLKALFVFPEGPLPSFENYQSTLIRHFLQGGIPVQVVSFSRIR